MTVSQNCRDAGWLVAQVKPRSEKLAITHLERQGFEHFCPMVGRPKIVRGKPTEGLEPFFPGYVFVRAAQHQRWQSINGTIGVLRLVSFGDEPARAPAGFVERLRHLADDDGKVCFQEDIAVGSMVRVVSGPFDEFCGSLAGYVGKDRVVVLLRLLSGETRVTLPRGSLVAA